MKQGWEYKKLGDVAEISAGQGAPQGEQNYCSDGIPFIKAGNLEDLVNGIDENSVQKVSQEVAQKHKLKLYKAGSVLFAKSGMSCMKGYVYTLKKDCYVVSHLAIIYPKSVNSNFLNYYLRQAKTYSLVKDAAYPSISLSDIALFPVPVPPVEEQKEICSLLDNLNLVIEKKKEQIAELDNLAQSLFYDMFGDPITNEKGWDVKTIKESCKRLYAGGDVPKERFCKEKNTDYTIPIFSNGTENNGLYGYTDEPRETENCITIAGRGTIGYCVIRREPFFPIIRLIVAVPKDEINVVYLKGVIDCLKLKGQGVAIPQLTIPMIKDNIIPVPPLPLQQAFAEKVKAIERQKELINQSIKDVQTLFDAKMDYYFGD